MITVLDERESYFLVTNGSQFAVVERRAGKYYSLHAGVRHGVALDDAGVLELIHEAGAHDEKAARRLFDEVSEQWRDIFEHLR
ncbi:hypothetical protein GCM10011611_25710 [Aliidongia dinghuensis]|uniref:Uncharacterized protein n=1 Tax=Aliidongia dinghuensis TaxID=1867774 RepID=A0A8J2YUQ8_9PROT|nr:hypothetical protein [Aliidongia dinghuensis]GGF18689.1 hypothetical protein GCM10011611_25710 [Aliidongia dinghuensis]